MLILAHFLVQLFQRGEEKGRGDERDSAVLHRQTYQVSFKEVYSERKLFF